MSVSPVGTLLKHWRGVRRVSQLELALRAEVTPRHVSFVETGRANPSREMVLTLARALDVPLRERNQMLLAAGFAPSYRQSQLDEPALAQVRAAPGFAPSSRQPQPEEPALAQVRAALERILSHHEPYPAVVMDRHWNVTQTNDAADGLFGWLHPEPIDAPNVVRMMFGPLRPYVANFDAVGEALIQRVHREAVGGVVDPATTDLLEEVLALPGIPAAWRVPDF